MGCAVLLERVCAVRHLMVITDGFTQEKMVVAALRIVMDLSVILLHTPAVMYVLLAMSPAVMGVIGRKMVYAVMDSG